MGMFSLSTDTKVSICLRERESEVSEVEEVGPLRTRERKPSGVDILNRSLVPCGDSGFILNLGVLLRWLLAECRQTSPLGEASITPCVDHECFSTSTKPGEPCLRLRNVVVDLVIGF